MNRVDDKIDNLLNTLEFAIIDLNICLAIAKTLSKVEWIRRDDLTELENYKKKLEEDMLQFCTKIDNGKFILIFNFTNF